MTNKFINLVTVTGADDSVDPQALAAVAERYPYVEFGILLSRSRMGASTTGVGTRFPSKEWLREFTRIYKLVDMNFAGHICGAWVREILMGKWPDAEFAEIDPEFISIFQRFQLNTHAEKHTWDLSAFRMILEDLWASDQDVIFQYDNVNYELLYACREAGDENISTLYDLSHGAGILPSAWPRVLPGIYCGYAGGLSPSNVAGQLAKLEEIIIPDTAAIWIDAETHLRSKNDSKFDLEKVEAFLEAARPWVVGEN